jgi:hypothetical protein
VRDSGLLRTAAGARITDQRQLKFLSQILVGIEGKGREVVRVFSGFLRT